MLEGLRVAAVAGLAMTVAMSGEVCALTGFWSLLYPTIHKMGDIGAGCGVGCSKHHEAGGPIDSTVIGRISESPTVERENAV